MTLSIPALLVVTGSAFAQLQQYDRTLDILSEPVATRWQHFGPPYFSTNEKLLNRFYSRFDNAGGVTVGVSFQQNLSLLVHARPKLCVIFDYNPGVTEILVPFMGQLIADSPTRRDFLSTLLGADFTAEETRQLLEGPISGCNHSHYCAETYGPGKSAKNAWTISATCCATSTWPACPRRRLPTSAARR